MTTSVWMGGRSNLSAESLWVAVDDTRGLRDGRGQYLRFRLRESGCFQQTFLRKPFAVEQARLVLGAAVAQDGDDGMARSQAPRELQRRGHVHAAGAAKEQAFIAQQAIYGAHALDVSDVQRVVDGRVLQIR